MKYLIEELEEQKDCFKFLLVLKKKGREGLYSAEFEEFNMNEQTARRARATLKDLQLIRVEERKIDGRPRLYSFLTSTGEQIASKIEDIEYLLKEIKN